MDKEFQLIAGRCGSCGCGCPAILEAANGQDIVIIGDAASALLSSAEVQQRIGSGEAAIVISKQLLREALSRLEKA